MGTCTTRFNLIREKEVYESPKMETITLEIPIPDQDFQLEERNTDSKFQEIWQYFDELANSEGWEFYQESEIFVRTMHVFSNIG